MCDDFLRLVRQAQMMCYRVSVGKIVPKTFGCPDALLRNYKRRPFGFVFDWLPPVAAEQIDCNEIFKKFDLNQKNW